MVANIGLPRPGHPNRGWHLWLVSTIMVIVAGIFVGVRLVARYLRGGLQADDWTILVALVRNRLRLGIVASVLAKLTRICRSFLSS